MLVGNEFQEEIGNEFQEEIGNEFQEEIVPGTNEYKKQLVWVKGCKYTLNLITNCALNSPVLVATSIVAVHTSSYSGLKGYIYNTII